MAASNQDKSLNNLLIHKRQGFYEYFERISNTGFPLSHCLEFLIIHKKSIQVNFCERMLPGNKTENDNSLQKSKYQIFWG